MARAWDTTRRLLVRYLHVVPPYVKSDGSAKASCRSSANAYPSFREIQPTLISHFVQSYDSRLGASERLVDELHAIGGRVAARRDAGSKLVFFTLLADHQELQVMASKSNFSSDAQWDHLKHAVRVGDIAYFKGCPGKTGTGQLSLIAQTCQVMAPALHQIPFKSGIQNPETRARQRTVDLLVSKELQHRLRMRAVVMNALRASLNARAFVEVDTPILTTQAGGAAARPFWTRQDPGAAFPPMALRVAPELYLKRLVIAGFDRIYEIGKQFRNEGIDATHNPEFTTCELYIAFANLDILKGLAESLIADMAEAVHGPENISSVNVSIDDETHHQINFKPPYATIDVISYLTKTLGPLPCLDTPDATKLLVQYLQKHGITLPSPPLTATRLMDTLISQVIEPQCIQPTFVVGHPRIMSPLAKSMPEDPHIAARFELFVGGKELINAYEELNDPEEQRRRFMQQQRDKEFGDAEAHIPDEDYCMALEYGLPPTGGMGIGLDRLLMFLTGVHHLREVIPFPMIKPSSMGEPDTAVKAG